MFAINKKIIVGGFNINRIQGYSFLKHIIHIHGDKINDGETFRNVINACPDQVGGSVGKTLIRDIDITAAIQIMLYDNLQPQLLLRWYNSFKNKDVEDDTFWSNWVDNEMKNKIKINEKKNEKQKYSKKMIKNIKLNQDMFIFMYKMLYNGIKENMEEVRIYIHVVCTYIYIYTVTVLIHSYIFSMYTYIHFICVNI